MHCLRRTCSVLLLAFVVSPVFAGNYRWTVQGPYGGQLRRIIHDATDPSIVYAATSNGFFRSVDGGRTWRATLRNLYVEDIAFASGASKLFATTYDDLYVSDDRGQTWAHLLELEAWSLAVSADGQVVYVANENGVIRSTDGGVTFGNPGTGLPADADVVAIAIDPQNPDVAYAADYWDLVFKTTDGGAHWTPARTGLNDVEEIYALLVDPANGATLYAGTYPWLYKSTNGGSSWSKLDAPEAAYLSLAIAPGIVATGSYIGVHMSTDGGATWTEPRLSSTRALSIDPKTPANIVASASSNVFVSTDGGVNYTLTGRGLVAMDVDSIAADPHDASTVYASGSAGLFKSANHGHTWTALGAGPDYPNGPPSYQIIPDPSTPQMLYALTWEGDVLRSIDGGEDWTTLNSGLPGNGELLAVDPNTSGVLWAFSIDGVYTRTGNNAWVRRSTGLPDNLYSNFITVTPGDSSTLYTGGWVGVFKSTNAGQSWTKLGNLEFISGFAIDPFDPSHLIAWGEETYESKNAGASWTPMAGLARGDAIAFDPSTPGRMYAHQYEILRSDDGGAHWTPLAAADGFVDSWRFAIAPGGKVLYAGGFDSAVWTWSYGKQRTVRR